MKIDMPLQEIENRKKSRDRWKYGIERGDGTDTMIESKHRHTNIILKLLIIATVKCFSRIPIDTKQ